MKKSILLIFMGFLASSCGLTEEEKMLNDYQQKEADLINLELKNLDFKILEITKIDEITGADSMKMIKNELAALWSRYPSQELIDTLSFDYMKWVTHHHIVLLDTVQKIYEKAIITAVEENDTFRETESVKQRKIVADQILEHEEKLRRMENLEKQHNQFIEKPEMVLTKKYKVKYASKKTSANDPVQTFEKYFYTNAHGTEFIRVEEVE